MSSMNWVSLLNAGQFNQLNAGTALANSITLTDISAGGNNAGQAFSIPANYLQIGQALTIAANGIVSTTATPNLTLGVYYGGVAGVALATTGAIATSSTITNACWNLSLTVRVEAVGASGSVRSIGSISGPYPSALVQVPATSSTGNQVTINTSAQNLLTIGAQWGTASASNSITCYQYTVQLLD